MTQLDHPNIVKLHEVKEKGVYKTINGCESECFAIVLEYIEGGELFEYVARCGRFSPEVSRTYFQMLIDALHYMHSKGISHRDIKPENILLDRDFNLKVTDFGFSTYLSRGQLHTKLGTEGYMAPEIRNRDYDGRDVDLFAAGIILFILYSGNPPFEKAANTDPYYKVFSAKNYTTFWNAHSRKKPAGFFSDEFKDLINHMLLPKVSERYTMEQVRTHKWTTGDCVALNDIFQEFTQRKNKIDADKQREREEKQRRREQMGEMELSGDRSTTEFANFFEILEQINVDPKLLPEAENIDKKDLILNETPKHFIALLKEFFEKSKDDNLIADSEESEKFIVTVDTQKFVVKIDMIYGVLGEEQKCSIVARLLKSG